MFFPVENPRIFFTILRNCLRRFLPYFIYLLLLFNILFIFLFIFIYIFVWHSTHIPASCLPTPALKTYRWLRSISNPHPLRGLSIPCRPLARASTPPPGAEPTIVDASRFGESSVCLTGLHPPVCFSQPTPGLQTASI